MLRTDRTRSADGTEIAFCEWGNPRGPEVLLVHGWLFSRLAFLRQREGELAERCRVVAYDLRGHGDSGKPERLDAYADQELWAKDLDCVLRAVGFRRPVLAGWSLGGRVAAHYLFVCGPARACALNLVSSRILQDPSQSVGSRSAGPAVVSASLEESIPATARFVGNCLNCALTRPEFEQLFGAAMAVPPVARRGASAWHVDYGTALDHTSLPVLVTHGTADSMVLPVAATEVARRMQGKLSLYEGCGHMPFWESPARFNAELAELACANWRAA